MACSLNSFSTEKKGITDEKIEDDVKDSVESISSHFRDRPYQREACLWMLRKEKRAENGLSGVGGGMLADEVGLGKTFMTAGLLAANRAKYTLVVTLTNVQTTWIEELNKFDDRLCAFTFPDRAESLSEIHEAPDKCVCVVSTYHQVRAQPRWMTGTQWDRIVLDEGHCARNPKTSTFRTLKTLPAKHRWVLSATPIHNSIRDMLTLLDWVGVDVRELVTKKRGRKKGSRNYAPARTIEEEEDEDEAADVQIDEVIRKQHEDALSMDARGEELLREVISQHVLRRTLDSEKHRAIDLQLPHLEEHVEIVDWNFEFEYALYESVRNALGRQLVSEKRDADAAHSGWTKQRNQNITIEAITRLRQICASFEIYESSVLNAHDRAYRKLADWQELIEDEGAKHDIDQKTRDEQYFFMAASRVDASDDEIEELRKTNVKRRKQLLLESVHPDTGIPYRMLIRDDSDDEKEQELERHKERPASSPPFVPNTEDPVDKFNSLVNIYGRPAISSKMSRLCNMIRVDCDNPGVTKIVVFTSFLEEMNILSDELAKHHAVETCKLYGGMDLGQRSDLLELFKDSKSSVKVLIAQIMCSSTGINLQCANVVYITCPTWNPCTEIQAIGRVYRQLQKHPVRVVRLVMKDTIETKCLETQRKKLDLIKKRLPDRP